MGFIQIYMGLYGGGTASVILPFEDGITTRVTLLGQSKFRIELIGTPETRLTLSGSSP